MAAFSAAIDIELVILDHVGTANLNTLGVNYICYIRDRISILELHIKCDKFFCLVGEYIYRLLKGVEHLIN